jgi:hypothetical protein
MHVVFVHGCLCVCMCMYFGVTTRTTSGPVASGGSAKHAVARFVIIDIIYKVGQICESVFAERLFVLYSCMCVHVCVNVFWCDNQKYQWSCCFGRERKTRGCKVQQFTVSQPNPNLKQYFASFIVI